MHGGRRGIPEADARQDRPCYLFDQLVADIAEGGGIVYLPTGFPEPHDIPGVRGTGPAHHATGRPQWLPERPGAVDRSLDSQAETRHQKASMMQDRYRLRQRIILRLHDGRPYPGPIRPALLPRPRRPNAAHGGLLGGTSTDRSGTPLRIGRGVASRTFAAGARLIEEGDRADHVIVILSGRTKICVEENGGESILAERGPGQLVGERAALQDERPFRECDSYRDGAGPGGTDGGLRGLHQRSSNGA